MITGKATPAGFSGSKIKAEIVTIVPATESSFATPSTSSGLVKSAPSSVWLPTSFPGTHVSVKDTLHDQFNSGLEVKTERDQRRTHLPLPSSHSSKQTVRRCVDLIRSATQKYETEQREPLFVLTGDVLYTRTAARSHAQLRGMCSCVRNEMVADKLRWWLRLRNQTRLVNNPQCPTTRGHLSQHPG